MNVLLITGTLAEETLKTHTQKTNVNATVLALKVPVAAFLTPQTIIAALKEVALSGFDMILVPGLMRGDTTTISAAVNVPTFKGPRYAADLPTILDCLDQVTLSTTVPACELLKEKLLENALQELTKVEQNKNALLKNPHNLLIGELAVGKDFPMRVLAEIVDAALMPTEQVQELAKQFVQQGADIIDVGMVAGESRPQDAKRLVKAIKSVVGIPVSIDTLNPQEIEAAVAAGADVVLSVDAGNLEQVAPFARDVTVVAIPTNQREGYFPKTAAERVKFLEQIITQAKKLGVNKILADLILEPSNILESFVAFRDFAQRNPTVPLFVGVSNVTELVDMDSVGVNGLLVDLSSEVNASVLLATEKSNKAKGTVKEEVTAAKMMFLAKKRGSVPKDLGLNLLVFKDKRNREEPYNRALEQLAPVTMATPTDFSVAIDKCGVFKFAIDRQQQTIAAIHYPSMDIATPDAIIKGKTAQDIYKKAQALCLISSVSHAAYVGAELAKAEIALKTGKEYLQETALF